MSARWRSARHDSRRHSSVKKSAFRSLVNGTGWQQGNRPAGAVPDTDTASRAVKGSGDSHRHGSRGSGCYRHIAESGDTQFKRTI